MAIHSTVTSRDRNKCNRVKMFLFSVINFQARVLANYEHDELVSLMLALLYDTVLSSLRTTALLLKILLFVYTYFVIKTGGPLPLERIVFMPIELKVYYGVSKLRIRNACDSQVSIYCTDPHRFNSCTLYRRLFFCCHAWFSFVRRQLVIVHLDAIAIDFCYCYWSCALVSMIIIISYRNKINLLYMNERSMLCKIFILTLWFSCCI